MLQRSLQASLLLVVAAQVVQRPREIRTELIVAGLVEPFQEADRALDGGDRMVELAGSLEDGAEEAQRVSEGHGPACVVVVQALIRLDGLPAGSHGLVDFVGDVVRDREVEQRVCELGQVSSGTEDFDCLGCGCHRFFCTPKVMQSGSQDLEGFAEVRVRAFAVELDGCTRLIQRRFVLAECCQLVAKEAVGASEVGCPLGPPCVAYGSA